MNEQEVRALVREAIAKQLGEPAPIGPGPGVWRGAPTRPRHVSHAIYMIPTESESGPCLIEPDVPCTHCDYCKSHGH